VSVPGTRSDLWKQRFATAMAGTWILLAISLALTAGISHGIWTYLTLDELTGWNGNVMQVHQHDSPEYKWFIAGMMACSFGQGGLLILLAVVFLSHWRWPAHLGLVAAWAVLPGAVVACEWWYEAPTLIGWGIHWITAHAAAYAAGGLVALVYGLRFVRLLVRILVPPGWRKPVTAFLERP
jgi:hypothetical protein